MTPEAAAGFLTAGRHSHASPAVAPAREGGAAAGGAGRHRRLGRRGGRGARPPVPPAPWYTYAKPRQLFRLLLLGSHFGRHPFPGSPGGWGLGSSCSAFSEQLAGLDA